MSKPEWTKIGSVEVCVGTDGSVGVAPLSERGVYCFKHGVRIAPLECKYDFESLYCQPPAPRHTIKHYADESCVVESTEQDEQGRPLRVAIVRANVGARSKWGATWSGGFEWCDDRQDAIAQAIRYVETGE